MRAAVYDNPGPPSVLIYADVPDPVCGPDEVLISVEAISIEGGDLINRRSTPQRPHRVVGYAAAGTVVAVGRDVTTRAVGDKVAAFNMHGSQAELCGVFMGPLFERPAMHSIVDDLLVAAAGGRIEVVIGRTFALKDAAKAHHYAETAKPLGRVVMRP